MRLHYFILFCLIKFWPELFDRYYNEYYEAWKNYRQPQKLRKFYKETLNQVANTEPVCCPSCWTVEPIAKVKTRKFTKKEQVAFDVIDKKQEFKWTENFTSPTKTKRTRKRK